MHIMVVSTSSSSSSPRLHYAAVGCVVWPGCRCCGFTVSYFRSGSIVHVLSVYAPTTFNNRAAAKVLGKEISHGISQCFTGAERKQFRVFCEFSVFAFLVICRNLIFSRRRIYYVIYNTWKQYKYKCISITFRSLLVFFCWDSLNKTEQDRRLADIAQFKPTY